MMSGKTLFISDLDGTLLDDTHKISQATRSLLNHAIERGALFSIATARTPATVSSIMRGINVTLPFVVMTGAALWDIRTGKYSDVQYFRPEQVESIVNAYREAGSGAFLYTLRPGSEAHPEGNKEIQIYHFGEMTGMEQTFMEERIRNPYKTFLVDSKGEWAHKEKFDDAVLFFGIRPDEEASRAFANISRIPGINPMYYHDWFGPEVAEVEAFPGGATKAKAIKRLARMAGADRIVVFGDNRNDLSMMAVADWSIAVDNALDEVKHAADEVIGSNEADAVARKILEEI